jgi:hypothetical protein
MSNTLSIYSRIKKVIWRDILLIFLAALVLGAPTLIYPFGRDQGQYAWIAESTLNGNLSYSDIFEIKPPFTHLVHQAALLFFGYDMASIRLLDLLWQFATAFLIYKIAIQIEQPRVTSIVAAVFYLLFYYHMDFWNSAQTDGFLSLPITAGILFFLHAQKKNHFVLYVASGVAISLGILFKYPIGILIVFLLLLVLIRLKKKALFPSLWMGVGFAIPLTISMLIMFLLGNLADFLWIQSIYIPAYSTILHKDLSYTGGILLGFLGTLITPVPGWVSLCGLYGLFSRFDRSRWMQTAVLAAWWASAVIHFVIQNKFYSYHALPIYAPLALMISNLFVDVRKTQGLIRFALGSIGIYLVAHLFFNSDFPQKYSRLYEVARGNITLQVAYGNELFNDHKDFSSRANMQAAGYLNAKTNPSERVFIWGFEPGIYFLSQRQNATRFIYNINLYGPNASLELRQGFLEEIREQIPIYIVIVMNDSMPFVTATSEDSWTSFNSFNEFHSFVLGNYRLETTIEDFVIYRLKP